MTFLTNSEEQTIALARQIAKRLKAGDVVLLQGDLGAGKTHFVKGIAQGLGIDKEVTSPTFALHNSYQTKDFSLNHFDFYRIDNVEDALQLGLAEFFGREDSVCFVEWAQNVAPLIPENAKKITITRLNDNVREIEIDNALLDD